MFQTRLVEKIKTQFQVQQYFSLKKKIWCLWYNVEKYFKQKRPKITI